MEAIQVPVRRVEDFFDNEYKGYAVYTIENRAIPSAIDGFKPSQRKIAYAANRLWKTGNEKPLKVFQLGGQLVPRLNAGRVALHDDVIDGEGFLEVETPILQPLYGGAAARPFVTDDARIVDRDHCQLETFTKSQRTYAGSEFWFLPACNPWGAELTLGPVLLIAAVLFGPRADASA